jgi:hypothetical protein
MKSFAIKYPLTAGFFVFLTVFIGGTLAGIILFSVLFAGKFDLHGVYIVIPIMFFLGSLILGAIAGPSTFAAFLDSEE